MSKSAIAVDLGGTTIKLGLVDQEEGILSRYECPTPVGKGEDAIVEAIASGIEILLKQSGTEKQRILGVGLGTPGYLDKNTGIVTNAPNIGWRLYPAKDRLEKLIDLPVRLDNDANLAAVGEMWLGAGQLAKQMIMVTLGTGVGGGIIVNGEVVSGFNGIGGEIGHITVNPNGVKCGCGKIGCLESESSATAIKRKVLSAIDQGVESSLQQVWKVKGEVTPRDVAEAANDGDQLAIQIYDEVAYYLALVLSGLTNALNPQKILIGGGVGNAGEVLFRPLRQYFNRFTLPEAAEVITIEPAKLGNDAGLLGAAYIVLQQLHNGIE